MEYLNGESDIELQYSDMHCNRDVIGTVNTTNPATEYY